MIRFLPRPPIESNQFGRAVRWPGVLRVGLLASCALTLLFPIAAAVYDQRSCGRVHPGVLGGANVDRAGRRIARRPARQPSLAARHEVAVWLACLHQIGTEAGLESFTSNGSWQFLACLPLRLPDNGQFTERGI